MKIKPILAIIVFLVSLMFLFGCVESEAPVKNSDEGMGDSGAEAQAPIELNLKVGEVAKTSKLEVTVKEVQDDAMMQVYSEMMHDYEIKTPSHGKKFVLVLIEAKNVGESEKYVMFNDFTLRDNNDYKYDADIETIMMENGLDDTNLYPNQKTQGEILFVVPKEATGLKVQYNFGFLDVKLATWEI